MVPQAGGRHPHDLWLAARDLGDNPGGSWTYPLLAQRALACSPNGLCRSYEDVSSWDLLEQILWLVADLDNRGVGDTYVFSLGIEMYDGSYYTRDGHLPLPKKKEPFRGRHSVALLGLQGDRLVFANSWGARWGDSGLGYISRDYFEAHVDSVMAMRSASIGPSGAMTSELHRRRWASGKLTEAPSIEDLAAAWRTPVPVTSWEAQSRDAIVRFSSRILTSIEQRRMHVVEARLDGALVGRAHVRHLSDGSAVADEFWIAPSFRRCGYGGLLLAEVESLARRDEVAALRLPLHEADAHVPLRARTFASRHGYVWSDETSRRPNTAGAATKTLKDG